VQGEEEKRPFQEKLATKLVIRKSCGS
jgi:hypothetical protein